MHGFGTAEVARLLGMSPRQIRRVARTGLLRPARVARGAYRFSFRDLVLLRAARSLAGAAVPGKRRRQRRRQVHADRAAVRRSRSGSRWPDRSSRVSARHAAVRVEAHGRHRVARIAVHLRGHGVYGRGDRGLGPAFEHRSRRAADGGRARGARRRLEAVGMRGFGRRRARELSYGQLRRALLARALIVNRRLLLLDEPFDGLDAPARGIMAAEIAAAVRRGTQVVLATHHREDVPAYVTRRLRLPFRRSAGQPR